MKEAIDETFKTMNLGYGGPFGATIKDNMGNIIAVTSNTVLKDNDPTAHAEINAIRIACKKLKTYNLEDYILYATGYPCPMCLSAIIWANIKTVYYGTNLEDAKKIGFKDKKIYEFFQKNNDSVLAITELDREKCLKLFDNYHNKIY